MEKDGLIPTTTTTTTTGGGGLSWQALVGEMKNNNNNNYSSCNSGGGIDQLATAPFLNLNWDQSSEQQAGNFESALSSLVSSPTASSSAAAAAAANSDSVVIRELIGRLGSICNNPNSPPNSQYQSSTNTSCYTTPLNSPPKLNLTMTMTMMQQQQQQQLMPFAADPGFVERAARFSCFGAGQRSYNNPQLVGVGVGELSSSQSLQKSNAGVQMGVNVMESSDHGGGQLDNDDDAMMMSMMMMTMMRPEDSAGSGRERMAASGGGEGNVRKRKAKAKPKAKDTAAAPPPPLKMADEENSNANKRCKSAPENGVETGKVEQDGESAHKQTKDKEKDNNAKPAEPPKLDYIHVRARRGQATDSHSLAERVRREKISERMKFLQDLVPGCNKVTGKAVMLDEIINYVQSLQRQVEFLSMKLATVNPRLDFNADGLLPKDTQQPASGLVSSSHLSFPLEQATSAAFSYSKQPQGQGQVPPHPSLQCFLTAGGMDTQCSVNPLDNGLRRSLSMHLPPLDGSFMDAASQLGAFWEDDLQSVVQMGFGQQNQLETISSSHNLQGTLPTNHMKIEL